MKMMIIKAVKYRIVGKRIMEYVCFVMRVSIGLIMNAEHVQ